MLLHNVCPEIIIVTFYFCFLFKAILYHRILWAYTRTQMEPESYWTSCLTILQVTQSSELYRCYHIYIYIWYMYICDTSDISQIAFIMAIYLEFLLLPFACRTFFSCMSTFRLWSNVVIVLVSLSYRKFYTFKMIYFYYDCY